MSRPTGPIDTYIENDHRAPMSRDAVQKLVDEGELLAVVVRIGRGETDRAGVIVFDPDGRLEQMARFFDECAEQLRDEARKAN